jgi:hypothetical protein
VRGVESPAKDAEELRGGSRTTNDACCFRLRYKDGPAQVTVISHQVTHHEQLDPHLVTFQSLLIPSTSLKALRKGSTFSLCCQIFATPLGAWSMDFLLAAEICSSGVLIPALQRFIPEAVRVLAWS